MNRRSAYTDYTAASTTRQTRTSMTPSLLRTPPGTHSRPTAPSPSSANVKPAAPAPVPMSMSASMRETEDDDDLVLSFLSALSERSGASERGSVGGEDERYEQEGIRMPQPRVRVASPPSVSDGEVFDVRSLDSESATGSRAISPFVFDVETETAQAQLVGPSFSVDPASGSASSGAILDTFSPIHLPHAPGIYGLSSTGGSLPHSSPPGYESRFVSLMPARSPLTQTTPPRGMSSPRSPRSDAGSAWTSASVDHPEREDARSPTRSEADFDFGSVSSAAGSVRSSPVHVGRGVGPMMTDVEADDESPAMGGVGARRRVRMRGA